ncbi:Di-haem oxidoreductase, putative peroxidase [Neorhodopirellula lusitana]|uniref:Di-haem oxidoreductase, putative peroxidase n=1 Tax=Neorhodopirellula lusitana TaxID=445327 RepID=A0ABY1Q618_9BACT|nr:di-heme oxidoredictase family protein [Neorhodopirellula lusitana]SMP60926.1 Di-haem oxidoreductase, putative peroxidase [Neorhodopirellula lusitana]
MATTDRCGLGWWMVLSLMVCPPVFAQDTAAGRELFEHEWEFVERAPNFMDFDAMGPMPPRRDREHGRGRGRGPRPDHRDNGHPLDNGRQLDSGIQLRSMLPANERGGLAEGLTVAGDGLGPLHNAASCAACHPGGGASGVNHNVTQITVDPRSPVFDLQPDRGRRGMPRNADMGLFPGLVTDNTLSFNTVVHDLSTRPGYESIRQRLSIGVPNGLQPEWFTPEQRTVAAIAEQPVVAGRYGTVDYYLSQRNTTPLHGMGDIEKISANRLKAVSLSQTRSSGGTISGRVAGKYGWRGQVSTLSDFVAGACATELGLNVAGIAQQAKDPADDRYRSLAADISATQVAELTSYVADLPAPSKQMLSLDERKRVRRGEYVFNSVGCGACHIADLQPARGIYSDLLLHDMGPELQDPLPAPAYQLASTQKTAPTGRYSSRYGGGQTASYPTESPPSRSGYRTGRSGYQSRRGHSMAETDSSVVTTGMPQAIPMAHPEKPQFPRGEVNEVDLRGRHRFTWDALQREWKTPPLWGVADSAPYLHDGRAKTLTDAIQWHGGEAEVAKRKFVSLDQDPKDLLLAFLGSLKAPLN